MKKFTAILIAALMLLSLASCGSAPTAKELLIDACKNTTAYNFDADIKRSTSGEGIAATLSFSVDGSSDGENMKASYILALAQMNLTGDIYYFRETHRLYSNIMGRWLVLDMDSMLTEEGISADILAGMEWLIENKADEIGLIFSDVSEKGGVYSFSVTVDSSIWKKILADRIAEELSAGTISIPDGYTAQEYADALLAVIANIKTDFSINKKDNTFESITSDLTPVFKAMLTGQDAESTTSDECIFSIYFRDIGNVPSITVDESAISDAVDITYLIPYIN